MQLILLIDDDPVRSAALAGTLRDNPFFQVIVREHLSVEAAQVWLVDLPGDVQPDLVVMSDTLVDLDTFMHLHPALRVAGITRVPLADRSKMYTTTWQNMHGEQETYQVGAGTYRRVYLIRDLGMEAVWTIPGITPIAFMSQVFGLLFSRPYPKE